MKVSDSNAPEFVRDLIGKTYEVPNSFAQTVGGRLVVMRNPSPMRWEYLPPLKPLRDERD